MRLSPHCNPCSTSLGRCRPRQSPNIASELSQPPPILPALWNYCNHPPLLFYCDTNSHDSRVLAPPPACARCQQHSCRLLRGTVGKTKPGHSSRYEPQFFVKNPQRSLPGCGKMSLFFFHERPLGPIQIFTTNKDCHHDVAMCTDTAQVPIPGHFILLTSERPLQTRGVLSYEQ